MSPYWSAKVQPVPYASLSDPQTLNLYAYVHKNPITGLDPDGHMSNADFSQMFMLGVAAQRAAWQAQLASEAAQQQDRQRQDNQAAASKTATGMPDAAQQQNVPMSTTTYKTATGAARAALDGVIGQSESLVGSTEDESYNLPMGSMPTRWQLRIKAALPSM